MLVPGGQYQGPILMHSGATETGNGEVVECIGANGAYTALALQVSGISGDEITFEASQDGTNWESVQFTLLATGTASEYASANGIYRATVLGLRSVRARISTRDEGTISIVAWLAA